MSEQQLTGRAGATTSLILGGAGRAGLSGLSNLDAVADATVTRRGERWWMAMGGMAADARGVGLYSALLPDGASLDSTAWQVVTDPADPSRALPLAPPPPPDAWDATGYHCVSYARGRTSGGSTVERLYYAGAESWDSITGPYRIGFLEWDGTGWARHPHPVFTAEAPWERGTVLEPNVHYEDGVWTLYYTAGLAEKDDPLIGIAQSHDGIGGWRRTGRPAPGPFDALALPAGQGYHRITARYPFLREPRSSDGLWWSRADRLDSPWTTGERVLAGADGTAWHDAGVWKPTAHLDRDRLVVFFNAAQRTEGRGLGTLGIGRLVLPLLPRP